MNTDVLRVAELLDNEDARARIAVHNIMAAVLHEVLSMSRSMDALWHPLGFMHATLLTRGSLSIRFHIWPELASPPGDLAASPIHDHRWALASQILCGTLINHTVAIDDSSEPDAHPMRVARIRYDGSDNYVEPTAHEVTWRVTRSSRFERGTRYTVPPGEFHFTAPGADRPVATVVRAQVERDAPPRTLLPPEHIGSSRMTRVACDPEVLFREVELVLNAMDAATG